MSHSTQTGASTASGSAQVGDSNVTPHLWHLSHRWPCPPLAPITIGLLLHSKCLPSLQAPLFTLPWPVRIGLGVYWTLQGQPSLQANTHRSLMSKLLLPSLWIY